MCRVNLEGFGDEIKRILIRILLVTSYTNQTWNSLSKWEKYFGPYKKTFGKEKIEQDSHERKQKKSSKFLPLLSIVQPQFLSLQTFFFQKAGIKADNSPLSNGSLTLPPEKNPSQVRKLKRKNLTWVHTHLKVTHSGGQRFSTTWSVQIGSNPHFSFLIKSLWPGRQNHIGKCQPSIEPWGVYVKGKRRSTSSKEGSGCCTHILDKNYINQQEMLLKFIRLTEHLNHGSGWSRKKKLQGKICKTWKRIVCEKWSENEEIACISGLSNGLMTMSYRVLN